MGLLLLLVLIFLLMGAYPAWPYSRDWGYRPSGMVGALLVVLVLLLVLQVIPIGWGPYYH